MSAIPDAIVLLLILLGTASLIRGSIGAVRAAATWRAGRRQSNAAPEAAPVPGASAALAQSQHGYEQTLMELIETIERDRSGRIMRQFMVAALRFQEGQTLTSAQRTKAEILAATGLVHLNDILNERRIEREAAS